MFCEQGKLGSGLLDKHTFPITAQKKPKSFFEQACRHGLHKASVFCEQGKLSIGVEKD